jgi:hypothetical protein
MIYDQRTKVSGAGKGQLARLGIEHSIDHGEELSNWKILNECAVQMFEGLRR